MNLLNLQGKNFGYPFPSSFSELLKVLCISLLCFNVQAKENLPSLNYLNQSHYQLNSKEISQWFVPTDRPIKALALVTHGLNLRPSKMNSIIEDLNDKGVLVLRLALKGHRGNLDEQREVTLKDWLDQYSYATRIMKDLKEQMKIPLYSVSYSLGGEIHFDTLTQFKQKVFDKSVFFAPAIWSYWYTLWPTVTFFLPDSFGIKSFNNKDYRIEASTSMAAYRALNEGKSLWSEFAKKKNFSMIEPFLVIMDPEDELISYAKVENFIKENPKIKAQVFVLKKVKPTINPSFHHLTIDKWAVGSEQWNAIEQAIFTYLDLNNRVK